MLFAFPSEPDGATASDAATVADEVESFKGALDILDALQLATGGGDRLHGQERGEEGKQNKQHVCCCPETTKDLSLG